MRLANKDNALRCSGITHWGVDLDAGRINLRVKLDEDAYSFWDKVLDHPYRVIKDVIMEEAGTDTGNQAAKYFIENKPCDMDDLLAIDRWKEERNRYETL